LTTARMRTQLDLICQARARPSQGQWVMSVTSLGGNRTSSDDPLLHLRELKTKARAVPHLQVGKLSLSSACELGLILRWDMQTL
jgi:hypothetical protein